MVRLTLLVAVLAIGATNAVRCELDPALYNIAAFDDVAVDFPATVVAPLCGRNRGAFALDPPDGHTYSCTVFPGTDGTWGGAQVKDANAIATLWGVGNLSDDAALAALDAFVGAVYDSTDHRVDDPQACEVSGLARLVCDDDDGDDNDDTTDDGDDTADDGDAIAIAMLKLGGNATTKIRAVTLAGLYANSTFAGEGVSYDTVDFAEMAALGLNSVKIPVAADRFLGDSSLLDNLTATIALAADAGLAVRRLTRALVARVCVRYASWFGVHPRSLLVVVTRRVSHHIIWTRLAGDARTRRRRRRRRSVRRRGRGERVSLYRHRERRRGVQRGLCALGPGVGLRSRRAGARRRAARRDWVGDARAAVARRRGDAVRRPRRRAHGGRGHGRVRRVARRPHQDVLPRGTLGMTSHIRSISFKYYE